METDIIADLTIELQNDPEFNADVLALKVRNAIREVKVKRNYGATNYTDEQIEKDLEKFYVVVENVARYDYNQIGVEGEKSHSENGINRTYVSRDSLFAVVHPFVDVI